MSIVGFDGRSFNEQPHYIDFAEQLERAVCGFEIPDLLRFGSDGDQLLDDPLA